jgi:hypothetical protein
MLATAASIRTRSSRVVRLGRRHCPRRDDALWSSPESVRSTVCVPTATLSPQMRLFIRVSQSNSAANGGATRRTLVRQSAAQPGENRVIHQAAATDCREHRAGRWAKGTRGSRPRRRPGSDTCSAGVADLAARRLMITFTVSQEPRIRVATEVRSVRWASPRSRRRGTRTRPGQFFGGHRVKHHIGHHFPRRRLLLAVGGLGIGCAEGLRRHDGNSRPRARIKPRCRWPTIE